MKISTNQQKVYTENITLKKSETTGGDNDRVSISGRNQPDLLHWSPMEGCYSKEKLEAWNDLLTTMSSSHNFGEIKKDLDLIESNLKKNETLEGATKQFLRVYSVAGGDDTTQMLFQIINDSLKPDETRKEATDQFIRLLDVEGCMEVKAVKKDFQMINDSLKPGETREEATEQYLKLLKFHPPEHKGLNKVNYDDARSDYSLINQYVSQKETRKELTDQFIRLTGHSPSYAQKIFKMIGESLKPDEKMKEGMDQYLNLANLPMSPYYTTSSYNLINQYVSPEKSREKLTDQFIEIFNKESSEYTPPNLSREDRVQEKFKKIEDMKALAEQRAEELLAYDETDKDVAKGRAGTVGLGKGFGVETDTKLWIEPPPTYVIRDPDTGNLQSMMSTKVNLDENEKMVTMDTVTFNKKGEHVLINRYTGTVEVLSDTLGKEKTVVEKIVYDPVNPEKTTYEKKEKSGEKKLYDKFETYADQYKGKLVNGFLSEW